LFSENVESVEWLDNSKEDPELVADRASLRVMRAQCKMSLRKRIYLWRRPLTDSREGFWVETV
jgi:hypothetical protein